MDSKYPKSFFKETFNPKKSIKSPREKADHFIANSFKNKKINTSLLRNIKSTYLKSSELSSRVLGKGSSLFTKALGKMDSVPAQTGKPLQLTKKAAKMKKTIDAIYSKNPPKAVESVHALLTTAKRDVHVKNRRFVKKFELFKKAKNSSSKKRSKKTQKIRSYLEKFSKKSPGHKFKSMRRRGEAASKIPKGSKPKTESHRQLSNISTKKTPRARAAGVSTKNNIKNLTERSMKSGKKTRTKSQHRVPKESIRTPKAGSRLLSKYSSLRLETSKKYYKGNKKKNYRRSQKTNHDSNKENADTNAQLGQKSNHGLQRVQLTNLRRAAQVEENKKFNSLRPLKNHGMTLNIDHHRFGLAGASKRATKDYLSARNTKKSFDFFPKPKTIKKGGITKIQVNSRIFKTSHADLAHQKKDDSRGSNFMSLARTIKRRNISEVNPSNVSSREPRDSRRPSSEDFFITLKTSERLETLREREETEGSSKKSSLQLPNSLAAIQKDEFWVSTVPKKKPKKNNLFEDLTSTEKTQKPSLDTIKSKQKQIKWRMRSILFDWLCEVSADYQLCRETYHYSINYVDQFLEKGKKINKTDFQLLGLTCLLIASKMEEVIPPQADELVYFLSGMYTTKDIHACELEVVQVGYFLK